MPYSIPTSVERRLLRAGYKKATTWGTAVAMAAGDEIKVKSISGMTHSRDYSPGQYANTPFVASGQLLDIKAPEPSLGGDLFFDPGALGVGIAQLFGTAGAPTVQGATTAQKHIFQWADLCAGFGTLVKEVPGLLYECASWKPADLSIKVSGGKIAFELKGKGNTVIDSSAVNGATQSGLLTNGGNIDTVIPFGVGPVKMNAASGADVAAATALVVSGLDIGFKRTYDDVHAAGGYSIIEPRESGFPEIKLKLDFPRYATDNSGLQAAMIAGTLQKVLIAFTSPLEAGTAYPYSLKFFFPSMRILTQNAPWEEIVKNGIELVAEQAAAAPTGMTYTRPYIELINKFATNYLA
jgi:hypothetical protein